MRNKTEERLRRLADVVGVREGHGWISDLARWIGTGRSVVTGWIGRDTIPSHRRDQVAERGFEGSQWYYEPTPDKESEPDTQEIETTDAEIEKAFDDLCKDVKEIARIDRNELFRLSGEVSERLKHIKARVADSQLQRDAGKKLSNDQ